MLDKVKQAIIALNPNDVVRADLDGFSPYSFLTNFPHHVKVLMDGLTDDEQMEYDDWESELLSNLNCDGVDAWKL